MDKPDFGSTTAVIIAVKKRITPRVLSAIGGLVVTMAGAIAWVDSIHQYKERVAKLEQEYEQERKQAAADRDADRELLHKIDTAVAVMSSQVAGIAQWRERIEEAADSPPHARKRR